MIEHIQKFFPSAEYFLENVFIYPWESDYFLQMRSGYHYELEKKISRSDFKADFKKTSKHWQLSHGKREVITAQGGKGLSFLSSEQIAKFERDIKDILHRKQRYREDGYDVWLYSRIVMRDNIIPNRFYYITPKGLLKKSEIPDYAGLLEYTDDQIRTVKHAPFIHKRKYNFDKAMLDKYKFRNYDLQVEINFLRSALSRLSKIYEPITGPEQVEINF